MEGSAAVSIASVVQDAGTIFSFFMTNLTTLLAATPIIIIPVALTLIRASTRNAKSLLFFSRGRRS